MLIVLKMLPRYLAILLLGTLLPMGVPMPVSAKQEPVPARATAWPPVPAGLTETVLPCGLRVIVQEDHQSPVVAVNMWVHAGGKDEDEIRSGYSHYLEHLTARGTRKRKPLQDRLDIFDVGGQNSANTYFDRTTYYNVVGTADFDLALDSLADTMQHATLPEAGIEAERKVVGEELRRFLDNPDMAAYRETWRLAFEPHPYARPVIGSFATLAGLKRKDFLEYYQRMYVPQNMVLAIVGDVDAQAVFQKVAKAFRGARKGGQSKPPAPPLPTSFKGYQELTQRLPVSRASVYLAFVVPGWRHPDRYKLEMLARILGASASSRLWQACVEGSRIAVSASAGLNTYEDLGLLTLWGIPLHAGEASRLEALMLQELARLAHDGPTDQELATVKRQAGLLQLFADEEYLSRAQDYGEAALYGGIRYHLDGQERLAAVTAEDVREVARRYLVKENLTAVRSLPREAPAPGLEDLAALARATNTLQCGTLSPVGLDFAKATYASGDATLASGSVQVARHSRTGNGARAAVLPAIRKVLPGGLPVMFRPRPGTGLVAVSFGARAGSRRDPVGQEGMAQLAAELLTDGTRQRGQLVLAEALQRLGGVYGTSADRDQLGVALTLSRQDAAEGIGLLSEVIREPSFTPEDFAKAQASLLARVQRRKDDIGSMAAEAYYRGLFAGSPYALPVSGTEASIPQIRLAALREQYFRLVVPGNSVLSVVGDLTEAELDRILADSGLAGWHAAEVPVAVALAAPRPESGVVKVPMDRQQSQIYVGYPAVGANHPDALPLRVLISVAGFRCFTGLVYGEALAYSTGGTSNMLDEAGQLGLYIGTAANNTDRAIQALQHELDRLVDEVIPPDELARTKARWLGGQAIADQRAGSVAAGYVNAELRGRGLDWRERDNARVQALTASELQALASKYLMPGKRLTVIVGPQQAH